MGDLAQRRRWREAQERRRLRKRGELEPWRPLAADLFAGAVKVTEADGSYCLWWTRAANPNGYGRVWWQGRSEVASRVSLEIKLGRPIAPGMWALHTCDNPPCIRPEHLFEGTPKENYDDMTDKQRAYWQAAKRQHAADQGPGEAGDRMGEVPGDPEEPAAENRPWLLDLRGGIHFHVPPR